MKSEKSLLTLNYEFGIMNYEEMTLRSGVKKFRSVGVQTIVLLQSTCLLVNLFTCQLIQGVQEFR